MSGTYNIGKWRMPYKILVRKPKGKGNLGYLDIDGGISY
jgi:hypothetical protein